MKSNHDNLMIQLAEKHKEIAKLISDSPTHYVDIPIYGNIGDLLIMKGTLNFIKSNKVNLRSTSAFFNFNINSINIGEVIIFQGGGNFGDLYPGPQQVRENVATQKKNNRIIILPQTIHFKSEQAYEESCKIFSKHPDLHIFTRDQNSYELASRMTANVYLAPDMAHQLWPIKKTAEPVVNSRLGIIRTDDESQMPKTDGDYDFVTDWPQLVGRRELLARSAYKALRALHILKLDRHIVSPASNLWIKWSDTLIADAVHLYSKYEHITTDRLHGHILACLMSKSHVVFDNNYGKNISYHREWTSSSELAKDKQP